VVIPAKAGITAVIPALVAITLSVGESERPRFEPRIIG